MRIISSGLPNLFFRNSRYEKKDVFKKRLKKNFFWTRLRKISEYFFFQTESDSAIRGCTFILERIFWKMKKNRKKMEFCQILKKIFLNKKRKIRKTFKTNKSVGKKRRLRKPLDFLSSEISYFQRKLIQAYWGKKHQRDFLDNSNGPITWNFILTSFLLVHLGQWGK